MEGVRGDLLTLKTRASAAAAYRAQRAYAAAMMRLTGGLLEAASTADPVVRREVEGFPDGLVIGMSVLGDTPRLRVQKRGGRLVRLPDDDPAAPGLEAVFKHVAHAFLVLSFQEGTAQAFANDRMISRGDPALSMRLVRCLNRVQAITLPPPVARRALKAYPAMPARERLALAARIYLTYAGALRGARDTSTRTP